MAYRQGRSGDGTRADLTGMDESGFTEGNVVIKAPYSSPNFKDARAITGKGRIASRFPLNAGIDVAGTAASSENARLNPGDEVGATGWLLDESRDGGLAEQATRAGQYWNAKRGLARYL